MIKAKVLIKEQYDHSGFDVIRIYLEPAYDQAERDLKMLNEHGGDYIYNLKETEIYNS